MVSVVFSVKIDEKLLRQFEKTIKKDGFRSRNEAIVFLIRSYVEVKNEKSIIHYFLDKIKR